MHTESLAMLLWSLSCLISLPIVYIICRFKYTRLPRPAHTSISSWRFHSQQVALKCRKSTGELHLVEIVDADLSGYEKDYHWIVRNSGGTGFGDNGSFNLRVASTFRVILLTNDAISSHLFHHPLIRNDSPIMKRDQYLSTLHRRVTSAMWTTKRFMSPLRLIPKIDPIKFILDYGSKR